MNDPNLVYRMILGYPRSDMVFGVLMSQIRVTVKATAIRRGLKLYECLLVYICHSVTC